MKWLRETIAKGRFVLNLDASGMESILEKSMAGMVEHGWIDPDLQPTTHYTRRVPKRTIQLFTILQLACLVVLWLVKTSTLAIIFPLFIALLVPVRLLAGRLFDKESLAALDAVEEPEEEETHWSV